VDVFVRKVRQKLEKVSPDWNYIHTHFGVGYRFDPERRDGGEPLPQPAVESPLDVEPPAVDATIEATRIEGDEPSALGDESATLLVP
jgi:hypothetical protein